MESGSALFKLFKSIAYAFILSSFREWNTKIVTGNPFFSDDY